MSSENDRQLSPWARRFQPYGPGDLFKQSNIAHSGLAPEFPSLHPKYNADEPQDASVPIAIPDGEDLDWLFTTETYQDATFWGMKTWQATILNKFVNFGPRFGTIDAGHSLDQPQGLAGQLSTSNEGEFFEHEVEVGLRIFELESIKVDETKWFRFFQKHHWYNTAQYSIDDDLIWNLLRPCIELADRMLKAAVNDQQEGLQTFIYGRLDYWENYMPDNPSPPSKLVLLSLDGERQWAGIRGEACNGEYMTAFGPNDWSARLEALLDGVAWYLYDAAMYSQWDKSMYAVTDVSNFQVATTIGIRGLLIDSIKNSKRLTLSERCFGILEIAITMIHELTHALVANRSRRDDETFANFLTPEDRGKSMGQPSLDGDESIEDGRSIENALFGGITVMKPERLGRSEQPYIHALVHKWPNTYSEPVFRLTAWHASKLLSEEFWSNTSIARKTDDFFHRREIFYTVWIGTGWDNVMINTHDTSLQADPEYMALVPEFTRRNDIWTSLRTDWFQQERDDWADTLWGDHDAWELLHQIPYYFQQRDEIACANIANDLVGKLDWKDDITYLSQIPDEDSSPKEVDQWYLHTIGLLLMASMPLRASRKKKPSKNTVANLTPSKAGSQKGAIPSLQVTHKATLGATIAGGTRCAPSELYDPLDSGGKVSTFTQDGYLDLVERLVDMIQSRQVVVDGDWIAELVSAWNNIKEARQGLRSDEWIAEWPFKVPHYTGWPNLRFWEPDTSSWTSILPDT
ncbi:hypothetical protein F5Y16DRAFT_403585 [Xylariaceae sp. FL0255]|nr:hypothetical protein F5Y16DRAFT_403585 [Xylariaceae sp. FL0255]